jgi:hypothetical protein
MKIQVDGKEYRIGFAYNIAMRTTTAFIRDETNNLEWKEYAVASEKDQFNHKVGRKIALSRAFDRMFGVIRDERHNPTPDSLTQLQLKREFTPKVWEALAKRGMKLIK